MAQAGTTQDVEQTLQKVLGEAVPNLPAPTAANTPVTNQQGESDLAASLGTVPTPLGKPGPDPSMASQAGGVPTTGYGTGLLEAIESGKTKIPGPPSTQQDINQILAPYINELSNLGPEYQQEMDFLKPYLAGTPMTFQGLEQQSQADESPTGSKSVAAASNAVSQAMEGEQAPGFGSEAQAAREFESTIPYSQILQSVLQAGKNEILGYSSVPNLTNINTQGWPSAISAIIPYLKKSIGYTDAGVPTPQTAAIQAQQNPGGYGSTNPNTQPQPVPVGSVSGGGNTN